MRFKNYLLREGNATISDSMGDLLQSLHELRDQYDSLNSKKVLSIVDGIISKVKVILSGNWKTEDPNEFAVLKVLQKIGWALSKAMEDKEFEMKQMVDGSIFEIENVLKMSGSPMNSLGDFNKKVDSPAQMPYNGSEEKKEQLDYKELQI